MWLTGFDAPCMHTMYVDKPMKGHGLMQAIARVNRVFRDKPAGLVVDYIGIAQNLKSALGAVSQRRPRADRHRRRPRPSRVMLEKYEIVRAMFRPDTKGGFDYRPALVPRRHAAAAACHHGGGHRLGADPPAGGRREGDHRGRQEARTSPLRRCGARALQGVRAGGGERCGPRDPRRGRILPGDPRRLGQERTGDGKKSAADRELAIQQIVSRAVVSTEIVDIMKAAGLESPDISILSDDFLAEVREIDEEEPRHRGAQEADQRRGALAGQAQRHAVQGLLANGWRRRLPAITPTRSRRRRCSKS